MRLNLFFGQSRPQTMSVRRVIRKTAVKLVKKSAYGADKPSMIISEEQVRLALTYLQSESGAPPVPSVHPVEGVSVELMDRVRSALAESPDTRDERVAMGRDMIASSDVTSEDVARKMIGRIISDSLR